MKIVLCAATLLELQSFIDYFESNFERISFSEYKRNSLTIFPIVTGVGSSSTCFSLARIKNLETIDLVLHVGISGSFDFNLSIGDCVEVTAEVFADLGAEEKDGTLQDLNQLNLLLPKQHPYSNGWIYNHSKVLNLNLPKVKGITVNMCSGAIQTIHQRKQKWQAQVESMEGAGIFYACRMMDVPFVSIRSISNFIEPRDKSKWNIPLALQNAHNFIIDIFETQF